MITETVKNEFAARARYVCGQAVPRLKLCSVDWAGNNGNSSTPDQPVSSSFLGPYYLPEPPGTGRFFSMAGITVDQEAQLASAIPAATPVAAADETEVPRAP